MSLIGPDQTFALSAVILAITAFGMWVERTRWGQKLGGPLVLLALAMALANIGVIPHSAPLFDNVTGFLVPVAIPLLLLRADFKTIFTESGPMFITFLAAAGATVIGSFVGALLIDMGPLEPEIAGTITSSYIGGSINFVATAEAVGIRDSSIYVAGLSADAAGAVFFLLVLMLMPALPFVRSAMPSRFIGGEAAVGPAREPATGPPEGQPFELARAANGLALSLVICALSAWLTALLGVESIFILVVTALALLVANFAKPVVRHVTAEFELGTLFMYLF
ncbi:MAG: DUF819 family protein, partial [Woeseiaceae bacterium]